MNWNSLNTVKMIILPKLIYKFNVISLKIPVALFFLLKKIYKLILKCIYFRHAKDPERSNNFEKKIRPQL